VADGPGSRDEPARPRRTTRLQQRRQRLQQIKERRSLLEKQLVGEQLLELHKMLEGRVSAIESLLQQGSGEGAAPHLLPSKQSSQEPGPQPQDWTLSGRIKEGVLADILQMISSNLMTGIFTVAHEDVRIRLYFNEGEVCHGDGMDLEGESAFFAAMAIEDGHFFFSDEEVAALPQTRTISSKTQFLILEALRQIDESRA
jgi:hypothetical protein